MATKAQKAADSLNSKIGLTFFENDVPDDSKPQPRQIFHDIMEIADSFCEYKCKIIMGHNTRGVLRYMLVLREHHAASHNWFRADLMCFDKPKNVGISEALNDENLNALASVPGIKWSAVSNTPLREDGTSS